MEIRTPATTVINEVLKVKKREKVLIIANPETSALAQDLWNASEEAGAKTTLVYQKKKRSLDYAEDCVIGALRSEPDVVLSISANKLGKDLEGISHPYMTEDGKTFNSIFDYLLSGKKNMRAVWTPGITQDMINRTVMIDYRLLESRCAMLVKKFKNAVSVHVTSPSGTDVLVPVKGRQVLVDNGNFSTPGSGGNIPAGEVFISPLVQGDQKTEGTIVFDGSMTFSEGDALLQTPITVKVDNGFVAEITGAEEAKCLLKDITAAEKESYELEKKGKLKEGQGMIYARNARNIGELGIGLNPQACVTGNMLEDEKAFRTCHFAIGENYDGDAPALIHFDGIVREPTITINYENGKSFVLLKNGDLTL